MAESRRPGSEPLPLGGAASLDSTVCDQSLFDSSKSSTQTITPPRPAGGPGSTSQEEPKKVVREHSATSPTRETNCSSLRVSGGPGDQERGPPEASSPLHGLAETPTPSHQGAAPQAPVSGTQESAYRGGNKSIQEMLACKQSMPVQQRNIITTVCRGEGGAQQPQGRCVCVSSPKSAQTGPLPPQCDMALCYGSYNHRVNFEDTFAAYCHPQPIPAPPQLLPRPAGVEPDYEVQCAAARPSATYHLPLPRLISSVSETCLDAKHLLRCCNLNCSWISSLPPGAGPQSQKHFSGEECCVSPVSHAGTGTRDAGTMTAPKELKDVGVQTGQVSTPHVFPQICLAEESRRETSCSRSLKKPGGAPKSPVKEVKWDAEGMTWEVYGASVDPEELGVAIQKHLELQIQETASHAAKLLRQDADASQQVGNGGCQRKRSRMMGSIPTPTCCARSTTAVD